MHTKYIYINCVVKYQSFIVFTQVLKNKKITVSLILSAHLSALEGGLKVEFSVRTSLLVLSTSFVHSNKQCNVFLKMAAYP